MSRACFVIFVSVLLLATGVAAAADLPSEAASSLHQAGVPLRPDAVFCTGSTEMGLRFATTVDPAKVRAWYVTQLPGWALLEDAKLGMWILYDGPPDVGGMASVGTFNHLLVQTNEKLPQWHDLPANMTTEIVVMAMHAAVPIPDGALAFVPAQEGWQVPDLPKKTAAEGFVGSLHRGQDMMSETERYYFYLQDENYTEHVIAYQDEIPTAVSARLYALAEGDRTVRVLGNLFVDEAMGTSLFDRSGDLQILPME